MEENNKRIIKNAIYLYGRQLVIMCISFFSTRIVLEKLGASDYGVNNVVGGFVSMFTMLNSILQTGTRRFLGLSIGKGNQEKLNVTFSTAVVIHVIIAIIVVIALETFGIWFLNSQLNIEASRMRAANWVFQFSVLTVFLGITQTPYTAAVTIHERFNIYAFMSIFDVVTKLLVLFLLVYIPGDKLIIYAALLACVSVVNIMIYRVYCKRQFAECRSKLLWDKSLCKQMLSFSGWGALGHFTVVLNGQGMSILINMFFNTVMNAARGLAGTVNFTIDQFINGFLTAAQPQLVKYYGKGDMEHFYKLIFNVSQYTLFLVALFAVPVLLEIDFVLQLWLGNVPQYTSAFIKITIICSLISYSNYMINYGITAAGRMKELNTLSIPCYLLTLPLVYVVLKLGMSPVYAYWISSIPPIISFLINLQILHKYTGFDSRRYLFNVFLKTILLLGVSCVPPYLVQQMMDSGIIRFLLVCSLSCISTIIMLWFFALNDDVKVMVTEKSKKILHRYDKNY